MFSKVVIYLENNRQFTYLPKLVQVTSQTTQIDKVSSVKPNRETDRFTTDNNNSCTRPCSLFPDAFIRAIRLDCDTIKCFNCLLKTDYVMTNLEGNMLIIIPIPYSTAK